MDPWTDPKFIQGFVGAMIVCSFIGTILGVAVWEGVMGLFDFVFSRFFRRPRDT